jgi:single-stranded DNA-specific DHH superfamily exonuclease
MDKVVDFLKGIGNRDNVVIIFHNDTDGCCSAALLDLFLQRRTGKEAYIISQPMPTDENLKRKVQTCVPSKIIFLDLAIDQQPDVLKSLAGFSDVLVIDHHKISNRLEHKKITYYNPRLEKPDVFKSCSLVTYEFCSKITDMEDVMWLAIVGAIADYDLKDSKSLMERGKEKYVSLQNKQPRDSVFGTLSQMIASAKATRTLTSEEIVKILEGIKDPEHFENYEKTDKLIKAYEETENELTRVMIDAEKIAQKHPKVIFYQMKSKLNLRATLSTKLSEKFPNRLVIIYEKVGNKIKISARNQNRIYDVAKLLKSAAKGMKASAGGHSAAGGGTVLEKDWETFKERLISLL